MPPKQSRACAGGIGEASKGTGCASHNMRADYFKKYRPTNQVRCDFRRRG